MQFLSARISRADSSAGLPSRQPRYERTGRKCQDRWIDYIYIENRKFGRMGSAMQWMGDVATRKTKDTTRKGLHLPLAIGT